MNILIFLRNPETYFYNFSFSDFSFPFSLTKCSYSLIGGISTRNEKKLFFLVFIRWINDQGIIKCLKSVCSIFTHHKEVLNFFLRENLSSSNFVQEKGSVFLKEKLAKC